jgi:anti-sigma B factor antagonist
MSSPGPADGDWGQDMEWAVLALTGDADLASAVPLRASLTAATINTPSWLVLDLAALDFIDSTGLGVLVGALRRVRAGGGEMRVAAAQPGIARVFSVTGLDRVFGLYPTVDEAKQAAFGASAG